MDRSEKPAGEGSTQVAYVPVRHDLLNVWVGHVLGRGGHKVVKRVCPGDHGVGERRWPPGDIRQRGHAVSPVLEVIPALAEIGLGGVIVDR